jgi:hypothetical protein
VGGESALIVMGGRRGKTDRTRLSEQLAVNVSRFGPASGYWATLRPSNLINFLVPHLTTSDP